MQKSFLYDPYNYLMDSRRPAWVKYQTLVRLMKRPSDDEEVIHWQQKRDGSHQVAQLRGKQLEDGSFPCMPWRHVHAFHLNMLLFMGYDHSDETVANAISSLPKYQLKEGGFNSDLRKPDGSIVFSRLKDGQLDCLTAFVAHILLDLGLEGDSHFQNLINILRNRQLENGGWICNRNKTDAPYCILAAIPWCFSVFSKLEGKISRNWLQPTIEIIEKHKLKIQKHGYQRDICFRCDEAILLPALSTLGFSMNDKLLRDLFHSLVKKQKPDGSWCFRGKPSGWYTIESVAAIQTAVGK